MTAAKWVNRNEAIQWVSTQVFERCSTLIEAFDALVYLQGYTYTNQCASIIDVPMFFTGSLTSRQVKQLFSDICTLMNYDVSANWNEYQTHNMTIATPEQTVDTTQTESTMTCVAVYVFEALMHACNNQKYNNCDIRDFEMSWTHLDYKFYNQNRNTFPYTLQQLIHKGYIDKVQITGKHGHFTRYRPTKYGLTRYHRYMNK